MPNLATGKGYINSPIQDIGLALHRTRTHQSFNRTSINNPNCDEFIPFEEMANSEPQTEKIPWYRRLLQNIADKSRALWKKVRQLNPFTQIFNFVEDIRIFSHLRNAKNRNNARTGEELSKYHRSLLYDPNNPDESKLFTEHYNPNNGKEKSLIIITLGNGQTLGESEEKVGLKKLFKLLKEKHPDTDIMLFRAGNASSELSYWACMTSDPSLHTKVVYEHSCNLINDRINRRGYFTNRNRVSKVISIGYSFGAGTQCNYLSDWQRIGNNTPVPLSVSIDAIELGTNGLGCPIIQRPNTSQRHYSFYQTNSTLVRGSRFNGLRQRDVCMCLPNDTHDSIDNNERLLNAIANIISRELGRLST